MLGNPISQKKRREIDTNPFFSECVHKYRHDVAHICRGRLTMEHPFGRSGGYRDVVIPCCESKNIGVFGIDKAWNRIVAIEIYFEELKAMSPKIDWEQEKQKYISFFLFNGG